ncbi:hypothetical protein [Streptomyces pratensis]|uniref:hypothetical protein n=1 Tax=Streptomyces pratensis TaxID=1169025 RepID=UPI00193265C8|nr:hypothetical protein [Streptomyces pratensis]
MLITSPSSGEAAALSGSDARYGSLEALLGPGDEGQRSRPSSLDGSAGARQINVAWMALDLQPARTDRVFPGASPGTVWIHTATEVPDTYRGHWHRASEPERLVALLEELGLMGRPSPEKAAPALFPEPWESESLFGRKADPQPPAAEPASAAVPASSAAPETSGRYALLSHWWWAIPGLVVGSALTLATLRSRARIREPGSRRQELLDG